MARQTVKANEFIAVEGLSKVIRGLKKVKLETTGTQASKAAAMLVQKEAQDRWTQQRIKPTTSHARSVIGRSATQRSAGIVLKYSRQPWAAGVEYGSKRYKQFRPWRGNRFTVAPGTSTGYVVQDAIRDNLTRVERLYADTFIAAIDKATK